MPFSNIDKPNSYFNTVLYTGTGATLSITGVGFQPDWVWTKGRSVAFSHYLMDSVRGVGKRIMSNSTSNEDSSIFGVSSFNSDGFTLGTDTGANNSGSTFVSWNWLASNTTTSNTSGTITSTVSANTTSGFSIVSYTGTGANATVGHGLGVAPKMIIVKRRNSTANWFVYHASIGNNGYIMLNSTDAKDQPNSTVWNNTSPTSSLFSLGTSSGINGSGGTYIAYCFAEVKGFSKAFSYTGNGSTDGSYVHLGFRPAYVIIKCSSNSGDGWFVFDNKRTTYNVMSTFLLANSYAADETNTNRNIDFLSNGIKLRNSDTSLNYSGYTYIGFAIAEQPFVSSKGIVANAR